MLLCNSAKGVGSGVRARRGGRASASWMLLRVGISIAGGRLMVRGGAEGSGARGGSNGSRRNRASVKESGGVWRRLMRMGSGRLLDAY